MYNPITISTPSKEKNTAPLSLKYNLGHGLIVLWTGANAENSTIAFVILGQQSMRGLGSKVLKNGLIM